MSLRSICLILLLVSSVSSEEFIPECRFYFRTAESVVSRADTVFNDFDYKLITNDILKSNSVESVLKLRNSANTRDLVDDVHNFNDFAYIGIVGVQLGPEEIARKKNLIPSPERASPKSNEGQKVMFALRLAPALGIVEISDEKGVRRFKVDRRNLEGFLKIYKTMYQMMRLDEWGETPEE